MEMETEMDTDHNKAATTTTTRTNDNDGAFTTTATIHHRIVEQLSMWVLYDTSIHSLLFYYTLLCSTQVT